MIDDPKLREFAITKLQDIQKQVNKGECLDKIDDMIAELLWKQETPKAEIDLEKTKKEVEEKHKMNET